MNIIDNGSKTQTSTILQIVVIVIFIAFLIFLVYYIFDDSGKKHHKNRHGIPYHNNSHRKHELYQINDANYDSVHNILRKSQLQPCGDEPGEHCANVHSFEDKVRGNTRDHHFDGYGTVDGNNERVLWKLDSNIRIGDLFDNYTK